MMKRIAKWIDVEIIEPIYWYWLRRICLAMPTCTLWRPHPVNRQVQFVLWPSLVIDELTVLIARNNDVGTLTGCFHRR